MKGYRLNEGKTAWEVLDGEGVVINTDTSAYYSLNHTGTRVFELLAAGPRSVADLTRDAIETFSATPEEASAGISHILELLLQENLIIEATPASDDTTASEHGSGADGGGAWQPPALTRHGELEQLVLSGE
jgi:hypothetical protein